MRDWQVFWVERCNWPGRQSYSRFQKSEGVGGGYRDSRTRGACVAGELLPSFLKFNCEPWRGLSEDNVQVLAGTARECRRNLPRNTTSAAVKAEDSCRLLLQKAILLLN